MEDRWFNHRSIARLNLPVLRFYSTLHLPIDSMPMQCCFLIQFNLHLLHTLWVDCRLPLSAGFRVPSFLFLEFFARDHCCLHLRVRASYFHISFPGRLNVIVFRQRGLLIAVLSFSFRTYILWTIHEAGRARSIPITWVFKDTRMHRHINSPSSNLIACTIENRVLKPRPNEIRNPTRALLCYKVLDKYNYLFND